MAVQFLDNFLSFIRRKRVPPMERAGTSGTAIWGGYVQQPEAKSDLTGRERYKTFSEALVNTSIVAAGVRYFLNLVSKAEWKVEPPEDGGAKAVEVAELIEDILLKDMDTPWHRVVRRAAMYRFYGFSIQEWTAKRRDDGAIGFLDIEPRPQITIERWDADVHGTIQGVVQRSPQTQLELYIPRSKVLYMVDDSLNDSPEGLGLLRHIAEPARRLRRLEQLEGWGYETDLRGIPLGRAPFSELQAMVQKNKLSSAERTRIEQGMKDFIEGHIKSPQLGLILDSLTYRTDDEKAAPSNVRKWDLELLKSGSTNLGDVAKAIQRLNREIARIIGVENILLGESGAGSLAMSRDKSDNFGLIVDSTLLELTEGFEVDVVNPIMALNGIPDEFKPTLKTDSIQHRDITEITDALVDMAQAGATLMSTDPAVGEVYDLLGLSRPPITMNDAVDSSLENDQPEPEKVPVRDEGDKKNA